MTTPTLVLVTGLPGSGKTSLARRIAAELAAAVVGHDVVMAGLRAYPSVWAAMRQLDQLDFRSVGWTVMGNLALAELREHRSVILDGVARPPEIERCRQIAQQAGCPSLVVLCSPPEQQEHRARIVGRTRDIPNWPELTWEDVVRTQSTWEVPRDVDLLIDSSRSIEESVHSVRSRCSASLGRSKR